MAHMPESGAILGTRGPLKAHSAVIGGNITKGFGHILHAVFGAVKLKHEVWCLWHGCTCHRVESLNGCSVDNFDTGHRQIHLDCVDHAVHGSVHRWKGADGGGDGFGLAAQAQGEGSDEAKCAFGADEEACQIIAGRCFAGFCACLDDTPVGENHFKADDIVTHGSVAHSCCARGACRGHTAERGVCARIDGKEQARGAQLFIELFARDPCFYDGNHIFLGKTTDCLHL